MLRTELDGAVLRVTLDRPEVLNAFNDELIAALTEVFTGISRSESSNPKSEIPNVNSQISDPQSEIRNPISEIRAVVLSGSGKSFCAGGDLEWMRKAASYSEEQNYQDALKLAHLFDSIARCPAVVVAKVHGFAFGGGCGLVAASDVAIADAGAKFCFSEVRLGLLPATISNFVIPKIGAGHARALFSTGEAFGAEKALRIGLVHDVAQAEELDVVVDEKLKAVLIAGPNACAASKKIVLDSPISIEESARRLAAARASEEGKEGVAAFLEKRKASWVREP